MSPNHSLHSTNHKPLNIHPQRTTSKDQNCSSQKQKWQRLRVQKCFCFSCWWWCQAFMLLMPQGLWKKGGGLMKGGTSSSALFRRGDQGRGRPAALTIRIIPVGHARIRMVHEIFLENMIQPTYIRENFVLFFYSFWWGWRA